MTGEVRDASTVVPGAEGSTPAGAVPPSGGLPEELTRPQDRPPQYPTATCTGARCGARIIWALTARGKRMPVDADPVDAVDGKGNVMLERGPGGVVVATVGNPAELLVPPRWVYRAHHSTCPAV